MVLVIDVGNTNIVLGVYKGSALVQNWRMGTDREKTSDEFGIFFASLFSHARIEMADISGVVISSVVPPIMYSLEHAVRKYFRVDPMIVGPGIKTGINIKYENPREVGADKIVNAVAGCELYGGPLIIVDFGTATTLCAISAKGEYLGGVICPGVKISADALFQKTARLPRIDIARPEATIGRNVVSSMQSGLFYGFAGQVDYIVRRMKAEMGSDKVRVVATGGMARLIAGGSETIDEVNSMLTLEGLRLIYDRNKPV